MLDFIEVAGKISMQNKRGEIDFSVGTDARGFRGMP
jgi:hypothetical protein